MNEVLSSDVQIKRYKQQIDELERRLSQVCAVYMMVVVVVCVVYVSVYVSECVVL